jgi:8-oxo-dGTP pyrophosphatase MutT (NUDIX family)
MTGINVFPLLARYELKIGAPWEPPDAIKARVSDIWAEEKKRRGDQLTNGRIYCLAEHRVDFLLIRPSEYRYVLARRRAPDLIKDGLSIRPLAVTGILLCTDGLVFGRRGDKVAADAGLWEPAPAGGLSRPDPRAQVLEELEEELGLGQSRIVLCEACGLVEDAPSGVFDVIFRLHTEATAQDVQAGYKTLGSNEYAELAIIRSEDVPAFLRAHHDRLIPALAPMLRLARIL